MAKNKHPIFRMHKIKVHHNRWLVWTVAYLVFVAIALLGYITVTSVNFDSELLLAENRYEPWRGYKNHELGFSLRYPGDWSIEAQSSTSVDFVPMDSFKSGVTVSVYEDSDERALRRSMEIESETATTLAGVEAVEITNRLTEGSVTETVLMAGHEERLYVMRGSRSAIRQFSHTFNFLND